MYTLKKNNRKIGTFSTYEKARQEARKKIRKQLDNPLSRLVFGYDDVSRNFPNITELGFSIHRQAS